MQKEIKIGAITVDRIIHLAEMFKGFKKQASVLKELDGKYWEVGLKIKKEGKTSTNLVKELRENF